jgi:hypothetical protein
MFRNIRFPGKILLNNSVCPLQRLARNLDTNGIGYLEVDYQVIFGRSLDWKVLWFRSFKDLVDVAHPLVTDLIHIWGHPR